MKWSQGLWRESPLEPTSGFLRNAGNLCRTRALDVSSPPSIGGRLIPRTRRFHSFGIHSCQGSRDSRPTGFSLPPVAESARAPRDCLPRQNCPALDRLFFLDSGLSPVGRESSRAHFSIPKERQQPPPNARVRHFLPAVNRWQTHPPHPPLPFLRDSFMSGLDGLSPRRFFHTSGCRRRYSPASIRTRKKRAAAEPGTLTIRVCPSSRTEPPEKGAKAWPTRSTNSTE